MDIDTPPGFRRREFLRLAGIGVVTVPLLGVTACSSGGTDSPQGKHGTIDVAATADPPSLDWTISEASATTRVGYHIFEQLFALDADLTVRPMLATGFETSDDLLHYMIRLREGVAFHDGSTMSAEDVVASLNRWGKLSGLGVAAFAHVDAVRADGDHAVEIVLTEPYSPLISNLAAPSLAMMVLPSDIADAAGEKPLNRSQLVGTGPFVFDSWQRGQQIALRSFPDYVSRDEDWGGLTGKKIASADKVNFHIVPEAQTRVSGMLADKYHYTGRIPKDSYERIESAKSLIPEQNSPNSFLAIGFDKSSAPFDDLRLRRAVNHALNKKDIALAVYGREEFFQLDGAIFFPEQKALYTSEGTGGYEAYDPDLARRLMDEAGYNGEPIRMIGTSTYADHHMSAQVEAQQLTDVGFNIDLQAYEWATYLERVVDPGNFDLFYTGYPPVWDPTGVLWFSPDHPGWWESPRLRSLLDKWTATTGEETRHQLLAEMNRLLYDELPIIKICNEVGLGAVSTELHSYEHWLDFRAWNTWVSSSGDSVY